MSDAALVVAVVGIGGLGWVVHRTRYRAITSGEWSALGEGVVRHVTTTTAAAGIDQGDGIVWRRPRRGVGSWWVEVMHLHRWVRFGHRAA